MEKSMKIDKNENAYIDSYMDRRKRQCEIANQRLKLIGLNIAKIMSDLKELLDDYKIQYENCRLLSDLVVEINDIMPFFHAELINKNKIVFIYNEKM